MCEQSLRVGTVRTCWRRGEVEKQQDVVGLWEECAEWLADDCASASRPSDRSELRASCHVGELGCKGFDSFLSYQPSRNVRSWTPCRFCFRRAHWNEASKNEHLHWALREENVWEEAVADQTVVASTCCVAPTNNKDNNSPGWRQTETPLCHFH